jgi:hypothetical protein
MAGDATGRRRLFLVAAPVFVAAVAVGLVVALALSARSDDGDAAAAPASSAADPSVASSPPATATVTPTASGPHGSEPAPPSPPGTTSGGLTARTLPAARTLGPGWKSRVDNGSAEEGYVGNGTPTQARDPHEVVMTVVPLGCEQRSSLPVPTHVLEADYRQGAHGTAGVGLRLRFAGSADAERFITHRRADLTACAAQPADGGVRIVSGLTTTGNGTYVSVRTDSMLPKAERTWTEVSAWIGGRDVELLAVNDTATKDEIGRLSGAARAVLR